MTIRDRESLALCGVLLAMLMAPASAWGAAACVPPPELKDALRQHAVADVYSNLGSWYGSHHQMECAVEAFQSARQLNPDSPRINYLLGVSLYMSGRYDESVPPLEQSVKSDPTELKPHTLLATVLSKLHRLRAASDEWEAALRIDPHSQTAQDGLCKTLLAQGQPDPVISLLTDARLDENLTIDLVQAYAMEYKLNEARKLLNQAIRTYPSSSALIYSLITVDVKEGHPEEGASVAEVFAKAHPQDMTAQKLYLRTLEFNGDPAIALPLATRLAAAMPHDPETLYLSGIDECEAGKYDLARKHLEEAVELDPAQYRDKYNVRYYLGTALFELNNYQDAKEQLEKAVEIEGANKDEMKPQARWELAMALRNLGEADKAREQLKIYQEQKQVLDNRTLAAQKVITAADELDRGETQKAIDRYREALAATPDDASIAYKLGLALDSTGDFAGERSVLTQAVKADPTFALAQYQLGYVESQQGDYSAAEQQFRLAVQAAPEYTRAWVSLAATLGMEARFPEAEQAVSHALRLAPRDEEALRLQKDLDAAQGQYR